MTDARTDVIARVRHGSRGQSAETVATELARIARGPAAKMPSDDPCVAFLAAIVGNQGTIAVARNRTETVKAVADYLYQRYRSHKLVAGSDPRLAALPWRDAGLLPRFGGAENGEPAALSYAQLGIAETGSIITLTGKSNPAANNLLVEDHIVIVHTNDLVVTLDEAWDRINGMIADKRPRGINMISGPSSTADIAMQLVMGAHGPRRWHVVLAGEVPADALAQARQLNGLD